MPKKQQSRGWVFAGVAAMLLLALFLSNLDNQKLYQSIQQKFSQSGIHMQAKAVSLSLMYLGSIRLDDVEIHSDAFDVSAQHIFIDLDLPALLTGKPLAQALYLKRAEINVLQQQEALWIKLIETQHVKLKRIDISQSEIHFEEQHLTLEHVDLDIRNIGKNKNPRLELRAHLGGGRLDAHGYLHLRQGGIVRGFGRIRLHDIPLHFLEYTPMASQTLNGSITTHINQDAAWQSFGHLSLSDETQKDTLTLRAKISGTQQQWFNIEDMVFTIPGAGALTVTGHCSTQEICRINLQSQRLTLSKLFALTQHHALAQALSSTAIQQLGIQTTWLNNKLSASGRMAWDNLDYQHGETSAHLDAGDITFSGLVREGDHSWSLDTALLTTYQDNEDKKDQLTLKQASYYHEKWLLPLSFQDSTFWLPFSQVVTSLLPHLPALSGEGDITGQLALHIKHQVFEEAIFEIDASNSTLHWKDAHKAKSVTLKAKGSYRPQSYDISLQLADAYASVRSNQHHLAFHNTDINFSQLHTSGVTLPKPYQALQGHIYGSGEFVGQRITDLLNFDAIAADVVMAHFGTTHDIWHGQLKLQHGKWSTPQLSWLHNQGTAIITIDKQGKFKLVADKLDTQALLTMQQLPFLQRGSIRSQKFKLPFATLHQFSSQYHDNIQNITLQEVKSNLYQGSFRAKKIKLSREHNIVQLQGSVQVGDVALQRWAWLKKQLQASMTGQLYATVNIQAAFDTQHRLQTWQGDGELIVYNARYIAESNQNQLTSDLFKVDFRKRTVFRSSIQTQNNGKQGIGTLNIKDNQQVSGQYRWLGKSVNIHGDWQHLRYQSPSNSSLKIKH